MFPSPADILSDLARVSRESVPLAIAWHAALAVAVIALVRGWRPTRRVATLSLVLPLVSVAALAALDGNVFNAAVVGVLALALAVLGWRLGAHPVERSAGWPFAVGVSMVVFAWVYPHFLGETPLLYLVAAPMGVIPCPSLALVTGVTLVADGFGARAWPAVVALAAIFYGAFGVFRLEVLLDLPLIAAGLLLMALAVFRRSPATTTSITDRASPQAS